MRNNVLVNNGMYCQTTLKTVTKTSTLYDKYFMVLWSLKMTPLNWCGT